MDTNTEFLKSFIQYSSDCPFSIYNLPYGVFLHPKDGLAKIGVAIGTCALDLSLLEANGLFKDIIDIEIFNQTSLNAFAALGSKTWSAIRKRLQNLLSIDNLELQNNNALIDSAFIPLKDLKMLNPFKIHGFTDFYASENHATNVGRLFRGNENALLPNWKYLPVGYNGRASTVFPSGTIIPRPKGQIKLPHEDRPFYTETKKLDFELELGVFVGVGNADAKPIMIENASDHIFGLVLLNDWSARDIQAFEYQPLGPFLSKSFATSISSWVVTMEALIPFMTDIPVQNPEPVAYLNGINLRIPDIKLKVEIQPHDSKESTTICETSSKNLYWSLEQMLAHHTVNNCIMQTGDLYGTGTISGMSAESWGSLLELSFNGQQPLQLEDGKTRTFLEDGDKITISGYCQNDNFTIGFGSLVGIIGEIIA
jgi:fumarylacetoacetase